MSEVSRREVAERSGVHHEQIDRLVTGRAGRSEILDDVSRSGPAAGPRWSLRRPVVFQRGDHFGRTVNVAARIGEYARAGEVLVSQDVVEASDLPDIEFTALGPGRAQGISEPLPLHAARRRT